MIGFLSWSFWPFSWVARIKAEAMGTWLFICYFSHMLTKRFTTELQPQPQSSYLICWKEVVKEKNVGSCWKHQVEDKSVRWSLWQEGRGVLSWSGCFWWGGWKVRTRFYHAILFAKHFREHLVSLSLNGREGSLDSLSSGKTQQSSLSVQVLPWNECCSTLNKAQSSILKKERKKRINLFLL
jgi:hypothetical protein